MGSTEAPTAPRMVVLLPVAVWLHQLEEWFGGFPAWFGATLGGELTPERFLLINAVGLVLFVGGTLAALLSPRMIWFPVALAALIGLNGVVHALLTVVTGSYSPGTVTGLVLYLPLSVVVFRFLAPRLSPPALAGSIAVGVLIHALATLSALS